jgi:hypothetical protein
MALGLNTGSNGADFLPIAVYDARAGRLFKVERTQGVNGWESERIDISSPAPTFAVDMGSISVGWAAFSTTGPDFHMVPLGQPLPARPSDQHKQAFKVRIAGKVLGGMREFAHSAKCVLAAMDDLHTRFEAAPEAAAGKIPIVKLAGTQPIVTTGPQGKSTNYAPQFEIVGWTARMEDMGERTVPAPGAKVAAPAKAANHVPPPTRKAERVKEPEPALDDMEMPF